MIMAKVFGNEVVGDDGDALKKIADLKSSYFIEFAYFG